MTQTCRRAAVPACETFTNFTSGAKPALNTVDLLVKAGDVVDVGILWGDWLAANGGRLKSSSWAASGSPAASPQTPTFVSSSQVFDKATGETIVLVDASAATPGDIYYVDNTVVIERDEDATNVAFLDRTLIRRLHLKVAAG